MRTFLTRIATPVLALAFASAALAQPTAFTYQGDLKSNGTPASGTHDFRFRLFDAAAAGVQIGSTICLDNVPVANGKFTATIDFGQQFASTAARYIEVDVRRDIGQPCTDVFGYVTLSPRQAITHTPRAAAANTAFSLSAPDGSPFNSLVVDNDGRVGIGTSTPGHSVTIANPAPTIALQDTDSTTQQVGYLSFRDSANTERAWIGFGTAGDPDFSLVTARPGCDIVLNNLSGGNVGIGTASPTAKLEVHGDIRLGASGQFRATAGDENLRLIRGSIRSDGVVLQGQGFSVSRVAVGDYLITFATPFSGVPTVTATVDDSLDSIILYHYFVAGVFSPNANSVRIRTRGHSSSTLPTGRTDQRFHFVAVGPR